MSVARSCLPCRAAKAKCDLIRPACGRCQARGQACIGQTPDEGFIFMDENQRAQRNSERARRERQTPLVSPLSFELEPASTSQSTMPQVQASTQTHAFDFKEIYPWLEQRYLTQIPRSLSQDLESRAVDRFFNAWTLFPCNKGLSPGHMHELPMLYFSAPSESILWHALRAIAFADLKYQFVGDTPFTTKALRHYGSALRHLQDIVDDEPMLADDRILVAMLLIDSFECLYLGRTEPLGPHFDAVMHVLIARGDDQFYNRVGFALWRVAHHRLLARQIMLREEPSPEQVAWIDKLDTDQVPLHISWDVQRMSSLAGAANRLVNGAAFPQIDPNEREEQVGQLITNIRDLLDSIEEWTTATAEVWKPKLKDTFELKPRDESNYLPTIPIPTFKCPKMLDHHDIWLAYMWNLHAASQIVLRESLIEVINHIASLRTGYRDEELEWQIEQQAAVQSLSSAIIRSFPQLLGFTYKETKGPYFPQGNVAGRFFSIFSMCVVRTATFTSDEHKQTAADVIEWINSSYGLG